ncbi:sigma-70 family RNA polymerase sigma factor [Planctomycetota bacterium]
MPQTDKQLMKRLQTRGDRQALGELVQRYKGPVYSLVFRIVEDRELSQDLLQEVFTSLLKASSYDPERPFKSWLFKVAVNRSLNAQRAKNIRQRHYREYAKGPGSMTETRDHEEFSKDDLDAIQVAVSDLPDNLKIPTMLHYFHQLSFAEISEVVDAPRSTVQSRLEKALSTMRERLGGAGFAGMVPLLESGLGRVPAESLPGEAESMLAELVRNCALPVSATGILATVGKVLMMKKLCLSVATLLFLTVSWCWWGQSFFSQIGEIKAFSEELIPTGDITDVTQDKPSSGLVQTPPAQDDEEIPADSEIAITDQPASSPAQASSQEVNHGPGIVHGRVTLDGKPLAGVLILLQKMERSDQGFNWLRDVTDAGGSYEIHNASPGLYSVSAQGTGRSAVRINISVKEDSDSLVNFDLLKKGDNTITGIVTDEQGQVVPLAKISISELPDRKEISKIQTGSDGSFSFPAEAGINYSLLVSAAGYSPKWRHGLSGGNCVYIFLGKGFGVKGVFLDRQTKQPITKFKVHILQESWPVKINGRSAIESSYYPNHFEYYEFNDPDGRFEITGIKTERWTTCILRSLEDQPRFGGLFKFKKQEDNIVLGNKVSALDQFSVVDAETAVFLSGVTVKYEAFGLTVAETQSDNTGRFTIPFFANSDSYELAYYFSKEGYGTMRVGGSKIAALFNCNPDDRKIKLARCIRSGRVLDPDGKPLANLPIYLDLQDNIDRLAYTDADGRFTVTCSNQGGHSIEISVIWLQDGHAISLSKSFDYEDYPVSRELLIQIPNTFCTVKGRVSCAGNPVPGALVTLDNYGCDDKYSSSMYADHNGNYQFLYVPAHRGAHLKCRQFSGWRRQIELEGKDVVECNIDAGDKTLKIKVLNKQTGKPVENAGVEGYLTPYSLSGRTDNKGIAIFHGLPEGSIKISLRKRFFKEFSEEIEIASDDKEKNVTLKYDPIDESPKIKIHGQVYYAGVSAKDYSVTATYYDGICGDWQESDYHKSEGYNLSLHLREKHLLHIYSKEFNVYRPVILPKAQDYKYDISVEGGFEITGRIIDKDGNPFGNVKVKIADETLTKLPDFDFKPWMSSEDGKDLEPRNYHIAKIKTGPDGIFSCTLPAGKYVLTGHYYPPEKGGNNGYNIGKQNFTVNGPVTDFNIEYNYKADED